MTLAEDNVPRERRDRASEPRGVRAGDFEAAFAAHAPDSEWSTAADEPDSQTYRGRDGLDRFVASLAELWEGRFDGLMEFGGYLDHGDWIIVPWSSRMRGKSSGIEVEVRETYAVLVNDRRIVRVEEYRSTDEALRPSSREAGAEAGDGDRTRTKSLEGSCAAITPRPRLNSSGS